MSESARNYRLPIIFFVLFVASLCGQIVTGFHVCNMAIAGHHGKPFLLPEYLHSGHFLDALFANWQGDCLLLIILLLLPFRGLAGQKKVLINEKILFLTLAAFFLLFVLHFYSSLIHYNDNRILAGMPVKKVVAYIGNAQFWFECFQNWQSAFLCSFCVVMLPLFRQQNGLLHTLPGKDTNIK